MKRLLSEAAERRRPASRRSSDVDFTVYRGESFGIVGTNGSGKSTVLQILAGTTLPTGGMLEVTGRVLPLLAVGTGFHPELTGRENVTLFASSLGSPARRHREPHGCTSPSSRSSSATWTRRSSASRAAWSSRLSFAIAMQFPADIYVFDEVLAVVDGEFQASLPRRRSRDLHREGRTVIFVSHSLDQVADVCDRVLWLESGQVRDMGRTDEVLGAYVKAHN